MNLLNDTANYNEKITMEKLTKTDKKSDKFHYQFRLQNNYWQEKLSTQLVPIQ